jgi:hypothetical protein
VSGEVDEVFNKTELKNVTAVEVLSTGNTIAPVISIFL